MKLRVSGDREHRFQAIVSTFWQVLDASADNSTGLRVSHLTDEEATMPSGRLSMRRIREVLRLRQQGLSERTIAATGEDKSRCHLSR